MSAATSRPTTPGLAGYAVGVLVAFAVCGTLLVVPELLSGDPGRMLAAVAFLPIAVTGLAAVGAPVAAAGVLLTHLLCRRVRTQGVHVGVAALTGLLLGAAYQPVVAGAVMTWWHPLAVGVGAGVGRAAVIPLVGRRRAVVPDFPAGR